MRICETCAYYAPSEVGSISNDLDGECHRNPPQVIAWPDVYNLCAFFPAVNREDWCGEWTNDSEGVGL